MLFNWNKKENNANKNHEMRYVEPDESKTIEKDGVIKKGTFSTSHKWARQSQSIARTVPKSEMSGWFNKNIVVSPNEIAVIVQDGKITKVVDSGKESVGGLFKTDSYFKDVDVFMMDTSPKDSKWEVGELWTNDNKEVSASGLLRYRISDPKKFFSMVNAYSSIDEKGGRFLSLEDINERIKSEVLTRVLEPETNSIEIADIRGNRDFQYKIENEIEIQLKETLGMWGLELLKFTTEWNLGKLTTVIKATNEFETEEELKELETLSKEGDLERDGRVKVAGVHAGYAPVLTENEILRAEEIKKVKNQMEKERLEDEADFRAAQEALKLKEQMHLVKAKGLRAELEVEQDMQDRKHTREIERLRLITEKGGVDVARVIAEGQEYSRLSPEQIKAIAQARESEARAKEDKVGFMKEVEDRERSDAYRRQELDSKLMDAAKPMATGASVKKCSHCGATVPMQASFCGECGGKLG